MNSAWIHWCVYLYFTLSPLRSCRQIEEGFRDLNRMVARQSNSYVKDSSYNDIRLAFSEKFHLGTFSSDRRGREVAMYRQLWKRSGYIQGKHLIKHMKRNIFNLSLNVI